MGLYEFALVGVALCGALSVLSLLSMVADAGSWRVFLGCTIFAGLFGLLAHGIGPDGFQSADIIPALSAAVEMFAGSSE